MVTARPGSPFGSQYEVLQDFRLQRQCCCWGFTTVTQVDVNFNCAWSKGAKTAWHASCSGTKACIVTTHTQMHYCARACCGPGKRGPSECDQSIADSNAPCLVLECCLSSFEIFHGVVFRSLSYRITELPGYHRSTRDLAEFESPVGGFLPPFWAMLVHTTVSRLQYCLM
jgi:hypothetical protein